MKGIQDVESGRVRLQVEKEPEKQPVVVEEEKEATGPWYEQLFRKTKEWFETEPDKEF
jgi:cell division protein FtsA